MITNSYHSSHFSNFRSPYIVESFGAEVWLGKPFTCAAYVEEARSCGHLEA